METLPIDLTHCIINQFTFSFILKLRLVCKTWKALMSGIRRLDISGTNKSPLCHYLFHMFPKLESVHGRPLTIFTMADLPRQLNDVDVIICSNDWYDSAMTSLISRLTEFGMINIRIKGISDIIRVTPDELMTDVNDHDELTRQLIIKYISVKKQAAKIRLNDAIFDLPWKAIDLLTVDHLTDEEAEVYSDLVKSGELKHVRGRLYSNGLGDVEYRQNA